jgi:hypothetical protein
MSEAGQTDGASLAGSGVRGRDAMFPEMDSNISQFPKLMKQLELGSADHPLADEHPLSDMTTKAWRNCCK